MMAPSSTGNISFIPHANDNEPKLHEHVSHRMRSPLTRYYASISGERILARYGINYAVHPTLSEGVTDVVIDKICDKDDCRYAALDTRSEMNSGFDNQGGVRHQSTLWHFLNP
jgi:hypothetical protein